METATLDFQIKQEGYQIEANTNEKGQYVLYPGGYRCVLINRTAYTLQARVKGNTTLTTLSPGCTLDLIFRLHPISNNESVVIELYLGKWEEVVNQDLSSPDLIMEFVVGVPHV